MSCYRWRKIIAWGLYGVLGMVRCSDRSVLHGFLNIFLQLLADTKVADC